MPGKKFEHEGDLATKSRAKTKKPPMYKVIILNDDYTPMDFVVMVLEAVFRKSRPDAVHVMLTVHKQGQGLAGVYTREVAETKVQQVEAMAQNDGYPLKCTIEAE